MVIDVSKKYLPYMSSGFSSPKLTLHVGDGFEFMKKHQGEFDVIITDSSDPVGPAESLFSISVPNNCSPTEADSLQRRFFWNSRNIDPRCVTKLKERASSTPSCCCSRK